MVSRAFKFCWFEDYFMQGYIRLRPTRVKFCLSYYLPSNLSTYYDIFPPQVVYEFALNIAYPRCVGFGRLRTLSFTKPWTSFCDLHHLWVAWWSVDSIWIMYDVPTSSMNFLLSRWLLTLSIVVVQGWEGSQLSHVGTPVAVFLHCSWCLLHSTHWYDTLTIRDSLSIAFISIRV